MGLFAVTFFYLSASEAGTPPSIRQPHPLGWMHAAPVGEMPGWKEDMWLHLETGLSSIWNAPHTMTDRRNNNTLEYFADYEQVSAILDVGGAITDRLSFTLEIPYAYRNGGMLDSFIDGFHVLLGNRRFNRQFYPKNEYNYSAETNGTEFYTEAEEPLRTVPHVKPKIKYWLGKWENSNCACGIAFSVQGKIPLQDKIYAGTTGDYDVYSLVHLGIPMGRNSSLWLTGAYSYLGDNPAFDEWPRNRKYEMYEISFDINIVKNLSLGFMARAESPYLNVDDLTYEDASPNPKIVERNRAASGWNSLVRWRGSDAIGIRYKPTKSSMLSFWVAEDWGIGPYDASDSIYSNGAPDVNFVLQTSFGW